MHATNESDRIPINNPTTVERTSDRELVVKRTINGPARVVWQAWTKAELLKQWWVPKSIGVALISCEADVRTGGHYRFVFRHGDAEMPFFGKYVEVTPHLRLVWTNDEAGEAGAVTTVTLEEKAGKTLVVMHELYPSKQALDECMASGEKSCMDETFNQLQELVTAV